MMWQFLEVAPQPYGECKVCLRHNCGEYTDEHGNKRQKWAHLPIELDRGGNLVIGYQCIKSLSEDAGVAVRVVEKEVIKPATDDDILRVFYMAAEAKRLVDETMDNPSAIIVKNAGPVVFPPIDEEPEQPKRQRRASK